MDIRQVGACFAGEVSGIDLTGALSPKEIAEIHAGMDTYAVLVFRGQALSDDQQLAFSRSLGDLEEAVGTSLRAPDEYRLPTTFADVSNLDKNNKPFARDDRRRLFAIGNRLWHSDSSFKVVPAMYSILHARSIPSRGGDTEFADMRTAYEALDPETRAEIENPFASTRKCIRAQLGFTDFSDEERMRFQPVRQSLVRVHLRQDENRSICHRTRAKSLAGRGQKRCRCCVIWQNTPHSANTCIAMHGRYMTSSSGTTAVQCIAHVRFRPRKSGICDAQRCVATVRQRYKRQPKPLSPIGS